MNRVMKKRTFSGTKDPRITDREIRGQKISAEAAREGMVLLKNDGILPLSKEQPLALLGAGAGKTIKGGTGSGDVCERHAVSVYEGMKEAGFTITSEDWIRDYAKRYETAREDWKQQIIREAGGTRTPSFFNVYASHAFSFPDGRTITEEDFRGGSLAVYVISRIAGEGADRKNIRGDYLLTEKEMQDLKSMEEMGKDIVVLLNIGGLIDLQVLEDNPSVRAILYMSQPGMEGGHAAAALLSGKENPSGKLTDSWARSYRDYPNAEYFSHVSGDVTREEYREGIFVGYRYFDTYEVPVQYCFGFGLSYTEFSIAPVSGVRAEDGSITLSFKVTNTGSTAGKEVVQVYGAAPMGRLRKEFRRLAGYGKTAVIQPGASAELSVSMEAKQFASFDSLTGSWVLEAGVYYLLAGSSLDDSRVCGAFELKETVLLEQLDGICPLREELQELEGREDRREQRLAELEAYAEKKGILPVCWNPAAAVRGEEKAGLADGEDAGIAVKGRENSSEEQKEWDLLRKEAAELAGKLTEEELISMSVGEISRGHDVALGASGIMVPGAAGESSSILEKTWGVPGVSMADGPAGIRVIPAYLANEETKQVFTQGFLGAIEQGFFAESLEEKEGCIMYYQYCTALPIGTVLAQTWNQELQAKAGRQVGLEMEELGISWWLAPGMNIHRNPLCGRNFEYFSEDPLVSGNTAAAITAGVQSVPGVGTTIKHFCCNNQEDNRMGSNSIVGERALREIYLRGFEIAIKTSQPMSVMSSYNLINGVHTANSRDVLMTVLRKEWGFRGFVMTDWTTTANGSLAHACVKNGNELIMPGSEEDLAEIREALKNGTLTRKELEESVARLLTVIFRTNAWEQE